jgi:septal ring factor EnvC (AmiA/AmiB activator)
MSNKIRQFVSFDWAMKDLHIQASEVEFSIKRAERAEAACEEERRQKEEERRQKEEERRQKERLIAKLKSSGMSDEEIQGVLQS